MMSSKSFELLLIASIALFPVSVTAQSEGDDQAEAPSLELLEFLGFWETPGGELIDPLNLQRSETVNVSEDEATSEQNEKVIVHD